jgi:tetratricopeptide (TPR) repeat protein
LGVARGAPEAEPKREVPEALVPVLNAAQRALEASDPAAAIRILRSYQGPEDALQQLLLGYAHFDLEAYEESEKAFVAALKLDPALDQATTGLARSRGAREDWAGVIEVLRGEVDPETSDAPELGLYARAAFERGDLRLAALLAERGVMRFPEDVPLRRLDVAILLEREDWDEAAEAALGLLAREPDDPLLWRQLAAATERSDSVLSVAALEAASLASLDDDRLKLGLAARLVEAGAAPAAAAVLEEVKAEVPGLDVVRRRVQRRPGSRVNSVESLGSRVDRGEASVMDYFELGRSLVERDPARARRLLETAVAACGQGGRMRDVATMAAEELMGLREPGEREAFLLAFQRQCPPEFAR